MPTLIDRVSVFYRSLFVVLPLAWGSTLGFRVWVEDLAVGDLDRDGRNEIVAVGRATKNAVVYQARYRGGRALHS